MAEKLTVWLRNQVHGMLQHCQCHGLHRCVSERPFADVPKPSALGMLQQLLHAVYYTAVIVKDLTANCTTTK